MTGDPRAVKFITTSRINELFTDILARGRVAREMTEFTSAIA